MCKKKTHPAEASQTKVLRSFPLQVLLSLFNVDLNLLEGSRGSNVIPDILEVFGREVRKWPRFSTEEFRNGHAMAVGGEDVGNLSIKGKRR
jgi:hypothetical protein